MVIHKQAIEKISASKTRKHTIVYLSFIYTSCLLHVFWIFKKVLNCFSSSTFTFTITNNFCYLNDAKCSSNIFKISTQSVTRAVQKNANVNCYYIICIVQEFLRESDAEQSLLFYGVERFFLDVREIRRCSKLEQRLQILIATDYREYMQRANYSKQNPFNRL